MRNKHLERDVSVKRAAAGASYTDKHHAELAESKVVLAREPQAARLGWRRRGRHDFPDRSSNLAVPALKLGGVSSSTVTTNSVRSQETVTPLPDVPRELLRVISIHCVGPP